MILIPVAVLTILLNAVSLLGLNVLGRSVLVPVIVMIALPCLVPLMIGKHSCARRGLVCVHVPNSLFRSYWRSSLPTFYVTTGCH